MQNFKADEIPEMREHGTRRRSLGVRARLVPLVLLGHLVMGGLVLLASPTADAGEDFEVDGIWRESDGSAVPATEQALIVDSVGQRLIEVRGSLDQTTNPRTILTFRDTTGAQVGSVLQINQRLVPSGNQLIQPAPFVLDASARRLYLVVHVVPVAGIVNVRTTGLLPRLLTIDIGDPSHPAFSLMADKALEALPEGARPMGMVMHASQSGARRFTIVGQVPAVEVLPRHQGVFIAEIDPDSGDPITPRIGPIAVPGCSRLIAERHQAAIARVVDGADPVGPATVLVGCAATAFHQVSAVVPSGAAVMAVLLANPAISRSYPVPGSYLNGESFFDSGAGGQGRMVLAGSGGSRPGRAVWVFDIEHRTLVGQIAAANLNAAGVDPTTGRIYVASDPGSASTPPEFQVMLIATDRGFPVRPAVEINPIRSKSGRIVVVPFNNTLLVPGREGVDEVYRIYHDRIGPERLAAGSPVDFSVLDDAVTGTDSPNYTAGAQAFGLRLRHVGGFANGKTNIDGLDANWWNEPLVSGGGDELGRSPAERTGIDDGDRDIHFARIARASLSADEANAVAVTADADERTAEDHRQGTKRAEEILSGDVEGGTGGATGEAWPFTEAQCSRFDGSREVVTGTDPDWAGGDGTAVDCDKAQGHVAASSHVEGVSVPGVLSVGSVRTSTDLRRVGDGGVEVTTRAEVRDVSIGELRIGLISATSTSTAFGGLEDPSGRETIPGASVAGYERRFDYVSAPGFSCGPNCDPEEVMEQVTSALAKVVLESGVQVEVELPGVETINTPRGSHAHAWREPWGLQQDVLLSNQDATEQQVPALRLTFRGDTDLPERVVIEFAGTEADATSIRAREIPPEPLDDVVADDEFFEDDGRVEDVNNLGNEGTEEFGSVPDQPTTQESAVPVESVLPATATRSEAQGSSLGESFFEQLEKGARWLLGRALPPFVLAAGVWLIFGTPPFLAARRRHLLKLSRLGQRR